MSKFESQEIQENITRRPKRTIVGFDHALELNAVLWNDEKGKKFLRKIIQNKRQRLELISFIWVSELFKNSIFRIKTVLVRIYGFAFSTRNFSSFENIFFFKLKNFRKYFFLLNFQFGIVQNYQLFESKSSSPQISL